MKVTLIHNPDSGDDTQPSGDQILRLIYGAGHAADYRSSKENDWDSTLKEPRDIVAVAGGDGVVGKVAKRLIGSATPIAVLPTGTANNVANALGLTDRTLKDLVIGWETARRTSFDVGVAEGPWGSKRFIEGAGIGLFTETMSQTKDDAHLARVRNADKVIASVLEMLIKRLRSYPAKTLEVRLDAQDLSGDYILLEAMNIGFVGPNLYLAPDADPGDGLLDIVCVSKSERGKLSSYLSNNVHDEVAPANLTVHRGQHLRIKWEGSPIHIDDETWPEAKGSPSSAGSDFIDVKVDPKALVFLTPG
jgi:diacylglycerol kinase family enzyme